MTIQLNGTTGILTFADKAEKIAFINNLAHHEDELTIYIKTEAPTEEKEGAKENKETA